MSGWINFINFNIKHRNSETETLCLLWTCIHNKQSYGIFFFSNSHSPNSSSVAAFIRQLSNVNCTYTYKHSHYSFLCALFRACWILTNFLWIFLLVRSPKRSGSIKSKSRVRCEQPHLFANPGNSAKFACDWFVREYYQRYKQSATKMATTQTTKTTGWPRTNSSSEMDVKPAVVLPKNTVANSMTINRTINLYAIPPHLHVMWLLLHHTRWFVRTGIRWPTTRLAPRIRCSRRIRRCRHDSNACATNSTGSACVDRWRVFYSFTSMDYRMCCCCSWAQRFSSFPAANWRPARTRSRAWSDCWQRYSILSTIISCGRAARGATNHRPRITTVDRNHHCRRWVVRMASSRTGLSRTRSAIGGVPTLSRPSIRTFRRTSPSRRNTNACSWCSCTKRVWMSPWEC